MEASLITLAFDPVRKTFPREELEDFCINKKVQKIEGHFFSHGEVPYWTVLIQFERLVNVQDALDGLTKVEHAVFERLRIWRKETAEEEGFPPYLIATNRQFAHIIPSF